jgi:hypothetical protein
MKARFAVILAAIALLGASCDTSSNSNGSSDPNSTGNSNSNANKSVIPEPPPPEIKPKEAVDPAFKSCNPYFPLVPGSQLKYTLVYSSGLVANVTVVVDRDNENGKAVFVETTRIMDKNGGGSKLATRTTKYVCDGERVQMIALSNDNKAEDNETHMEMIFNGSALAMLDPSSLKPKARWSYSFSQTFQVPGKPPQSGGKSTTMDFEVAGADTTKVPAGTFKTMKISHKAGAHEISEYYASGIGLVKRENDDGTRWELTEFSGLKAAD